MFAPPLALCSVVGGGMVSSGSDRGSTEQETASFTLHRISACSDRLISVWSQTHPYLPGGGHTCITGPPRQ